MQVYHGMPDTILYDYSGPVHIVQVRFDLIAHPQILPVHLMTAFILYIILQAAKVASYAHDCNVPRLMHDSASYFPLYNIGKRMSK